MSMTYYWKESSRMTGDANAAGQALEAIQEEHGAISPEIVVDNAKPNHSPLHEYFEWDDPTAAKEHRLNQARYLIRMITVKIERPDGEEVTTRAFVEIKQPEAVGNYMSLSAVIQDDDLRSILIKQALHDIDVFRRKYAVLVEVMSLVDELEAALIGVE